MLCRLRMLLSHQTLHVLLLTLMFAAVPHTQQVQLPKQQLLQAIRPPQVSCKTPCSSKPTTTNPSCPKLH
jgi:hypothetical protein